MRKVLLSFDGAQHDIDGMCVGGKVGPRAVGRLDCDKRPFAFERDSRLCLMFLFRFRLVMGTRNDRWLALELTAEQAAFLKKLNPCFRERHVESTAPGELLSADTFS